MHMNELQRSERNDVYEEVTHDIVLDDKTPLPYRF